MVRPAHPARVAGEHLDVAGDEHMVDRGTQRLRCGRGPGAFCGARALLSRVDEVRTLGQRAAVDGWDVNMGALAVKAGLTGPDAEDVLFASTRDVTLVAAGAGLAALAVRSWARGAVGPGT